VCVWGGVGEEEAELRQRQQQRQQKRSGDFFFFKVSTMWASEEGILPLLLLLFQCRWVVVVVIIDLQFVYLGLACMHACAYPWRSKTDRHTHIQTDRSVLNTSELSERPRPLSHFVFSGKQASKQW
jgi:hypothetical protein